jgi:hypothetical protein
VRPTAELGEGDERGEKKLPNLRAYLVGSYFRGPPKYAGGKSAAGLPFTAAP